MTNKGGFSGFKHTEPHNTSFLKQSFSFENFKNF